MNVSIETVFRRAAVRSPGPGLLASRSFWIGGLASALVWAGAALLAVVWL